MIHNTRSWRKTLSALVCAITALGWVGVVEPAHGQLGFQMQMQMQQWNQQQQARNHGFERTWAMQQQAMHRRLYGNPSSQPPRARAGRTYRDDYPRTAARQIPAAPIQPGDTVVVTHGSTPLKIGTQHVAEVDPGTMLTVIRRKGEWLGVRVSQDGETLAGWIHSRHVRRSKDQTERNN